MLTVILLSSIRFEETFPQGVLGFSKLQRKWLNATLRQEIDVQPWDPSMDGREVYLSTLEVEVGELSTALLQKSECRMYFWLTLLSIGMTWTIGWLLRQERRCAWRL